MRTKLRIISGICICYCGYYIMYLSLSSSLLPCGARFEVSERYIGGLTYKSSNFRWIWIAARPARRGNIHCPSLRVRSGSPLILDREPLLAEALADAEEIFCIEGCATDQSAVHILFREDFDSI